MPDFKGIGIFWHALSRPHNPLVAGSSPAGPTNYFFLIVPTIALPSSTQEILDCLRATAAETLERKRRLGHYAVIWQDGKPVLIGEDAPEQPQCQPADEQKPN